MGDQPDLATQIGQATGVDPGRVQEIVQLALEELHRITIVHENGPKEAMLEACFCFGGEAAFHLVGLFAATHHYHGQDDDAGMWCDVVKCLIPNEYAEGCERIKPWFREKTLERLLQDADRRNRARSVRENDDPD
jgi:hypothetical protein